MVFNNLFLSMSGCAIGNDGQLLDASEIQFFNDVDDTEPISGPSASVTTSIHPFFGAPSNSRVTKTAGSRRTTRISRPSTKVCDPDNAEVPTARTLPMKRMSTTVTTGRRVSRKVLPDTDVESDDNISDHIANATIPASDEDEMSTEHRQDTEPEHPPLLDAGDSDEEDNVDAAYAQTKGLGDADRLVCYVFLIHSSY
jgi:hypothetical protein